MTERLLLIAAVASLSVFATARAQDKAPEAAGRSATLKDPAAQSSYAIGYNLGSSLRHDALSIDVQALGLGVRDAMAGADPQLGTAKLKEVFADLQAQVKSHRAALFAQSAQTNKVEGESFLKANIGRKGVVALPSGLQYEIVKAGSGATPKPTDVVDCNYRGTLINGTEFDSSYARGKPATFPVNGVIKGWTEALQHMPVGSKWKLYIPPYLAYGDEGREGVIGPDATLIFEVELVDIQGKD